MTGDMRGGLGRMAMMGLAASAIATLSTRSGKHARGSLPKKYAKQLRRRRQELAKAGRRNARNAAR